MSAHSPAPSRSRSKEHTPSRVCLLFALVSLIAAGCRRWQLAHWPEQAASQTQASACTRTAPRLHRAVHRAGPARAKAATSGGHQYRQQARESLPIRCKRFKLIRTQPTQSTGRSSVSPWPTGWAAAAILATSGFGGASLTARRRPPAHSGWRAVCSSLRGSESVAAGQAAPPSRSVARQRLLPKAPKRRDQREPLSQPEPEGPPLS